MDAKNTLTQHTAVGIFSFLLVVLFYNIVGVELAAALGRTSFILLFLVLAIGPSVKLKMPTHPSSPLLVPWSWRGELGIWFTLTGLAHFGLLLAERPLSRLIRIGGSGYSLANLIGLVALVWAVILASTSFRKAIVHFGVDSWRWLHKGTYVAFYLLSAHYMYFQFFSERGAMGKDWFGYAAITMSVAIIVLQFAAFFKVSGAHRKNTNNTDIIEP